MTRRSINKALYNNVYSQHKPPNKSPTLHSKRQSALLGLSVYKFVFTTNIAFGAAFLVCLSLLLQPVTFVHAQESDPQSLPDTATLDTQSVANTTEVDAEAIEQSPNTSSDLPENVSDNGDDEADIAVADPNADESEPVTTTLEETSSLSNTEQTVTATTASQTDQEVSEADSNPEVADTTSDQPATEPQTDADVTAATTTEPQEPEQGAAASSTATSTQQDVAQAVDTSQTTTTPNTNQATDNSSDQTSGTTPDTVTATNEQVEASSTDQSTDSQDNSDITVGSTTPVSEPAQTTVVSNVQTDNVLAFNKNECTEVEDGSFYCQKISYDTIAEDDLFAAPDATGDMEIYVIQKGQQIKVTDNAVDDASPYYDARSKTVVWHRLIEDRYQIISYDVETGEEEQITDSTVNNMEPTKNGDYTVWQRWVQNNWEIILLNDGVETQITDSVEHDIAPHIRGDLIIWNVRSSDGTQSLMTYDIGSEVFNEIKDSDGVSVTNPRMLVMYEAQYQNGDTVMKGFDLVTGEVVPIERIPRDLPTDIPSPETTGEVRALPTNPQTEEDESSDTDFDTDEPITDTTQYEEGDLVLTASSTASTTPVIQDVDFDLDLRPDDSQATTTDSVVEQAAIPDVVIPEFNQNDVVDQASSTQDR